jgi:hypothetical protein
MDWANAAANVGSHFIVNNLFQSAFVMLWVNSQFWIAEIMVVMNFLNLTILYFRHRATPPCKHIFGSILPWFTGTQSSSHVDNL